MRIFEDMTIFAGAQTIEYLDQPLHNVTMWRGVSTLGYVRVGGNKDIRHMQD